MMRTLRKAILLLFGQLALVSLLLFVVLLVPSTSHAANSKVPSAYAAVDKDGGLSISGTEFFCDFASTAEVICKRSSTASELTADGTSKEMSYWFDPELSKKAGHDVFRPDGGTRQAEFGWLHFPRSAQGDYSLGQVSTSSLDGEGGVYDDDVNTDKFKKDVGDTSTCSVRKFRNGKGTITCKIGGSKGGRSVTVTQYKTGYSNFTELKKCDKGGLGFFLCPIQNMFWDTIRLTTGWIGNILDVNTSNFQNTTIREASNNLLGVANAVYALVFLVIIFANGLSLNLDSYMLKKMVPRLVVAIILSQFAFFLTGAFIDFGNVLGRGVQAFFEQLAPVTNPGAGLFAVSAIAGLGIMIALILSLFILIAILIALVVLMIRQAILYVLILVAPLAIAARVLPNTDKLFKMWLDNLIKLVLMYPIVVAIISGSAFLGSVMMGNKNSLAIQIMGVLLPFIGLALLPKAFKWSGNIMHATGGKLAGWGAGGFKKGVVQPLKGAAKDTLNDQRRLQGAKLAASDSKLAQLGSGVVGGKLGASLQTRKGHAERLRMQANAAAEERKLEDAKMSVLSGPALHKEAEEAGKALAKNPADIRAKARMESVLARAGAVSDMNAVARANNAFTSSMTDKVAANDTWGSALGNSGIMGDIKEKSPELSSVGTFSFDAAGSRSLDETWSVKDQGKHAGGTGTGTPNGVRIAVTNTKAIDLSGKNRSGLAGLSKDTVKSIATAVADPASRAAQLKSLSIEEMGQLTDPRYAPKDPGAKEHWRKVADAVVADYGALAATDPAARAKVNAANQIIRAGW